MVLYLGGNKVKINLDNTVCHLRLFSETPITNRVRLLSSEGYILKDFGGLYLITEEDE